MTAVLFKRLLTMVVMALPVAACDSVFDRRPPPPCPPIFVLKDAESFIRYKPGNSRDIIDVQFRGKIIDFRALCEYNRKRTKVEIGLNLAFELSRGPANRDRKVAFQYFVAIPQFHPAPQGRNIFSIRSEFAEREQWARTNDEIELVIPLDPKVSRDKYAIYLGFQLTGEELKDNRRQTKF